MPSYKRTVYLLPAGIVVLGATIAILVALVGTAAAAPRPATVSSVDTGSQNFRGEQDLTGAAARLGATPTIPAAVSAPKITEALQPGQTVSAVVSPAARYDPAHEHITPGNGSDPVYGPTLWTPASGPTSAPQPGQTISLLTAPSAPKITAALQPGQTSSSVTPGNGSDPVYGPTLWTPASGPTSAPQPGQTGW
ncbi:MAG: hypothetical protein ABSB34_09075 [Candidatus Limnocylindrales bacterium]|jgi:hypothetical protein